MGELGSLDAHLQSCDYALQVPCKYKEFGCQVELSRKDLKEHEEDDKLHLILTQEKLLELNKKVSPCTFKLTNYPQHKRDDTEFYSPPFYTSNKGYKMCIRLNANGHKIGKGTHVSMFAYLMKGDNDDFLSWLFPGTVTIELLNQLEDNNHYKKTLSFPVDDMVSQRVVDGQRAPKGYGYAEFISHANLDYNPFFKTQYLKDDTLVVRVSIQVPDYKPWLECTL